jgi:uncharacterized protein (TIGR00369 family)
MQTDQTVEQYNEGNKNTLMGALGILFISVKDATITASMPVDGRTVQPFGFLHGGATLALAETVAGQGSHLLCKNGEHVFGVQVSGNHLSSAAQGDTVIAVATLLHKGKSTHVWNVDVTSHSTGKLISTIRVVNSVFKKL